MSELGEVNGDSPGGMNGDSHGEVNGDSPGGTNGDSHGEVNGDSPGGTNGDSPGGTNGDSPGGAAAQCGGGPPGSPGAGGFAFSEKPTMEDIRRLQAQFTDERAWGQFHRPRNLLLALIGEVGEVAELFQWRGEAAEGLPDWKAAEREQLEQELSDVLIYLLELAEKCHVDLPQAVLRKMALNRRKYPVSKAFGSARKYTEFAEP